VGHWAEASPTLDVRLHEWLGGAIRWVPLFTHPAPFGAKRMERLAAIATPKEAISSSGEVSTTIENGKPPAAQERGPPTSSDSETGN